MLPVNPSSVRVGRRIVAAWLDVLRERYDVNTVLLLVTELLVNAVDRAGAPFRLSMWAAGGRLHIETRDESTTALALGPLKLPGPGMPGVWPPPMGGGPTAVGPALSRSETRAMLLLRAHVLALGHSGVRVELVERMAEMLNRDLIPVVPEQGSLGASGDLAPLAHLALPLLGMGELLAGDSTGNAAPAGEILRQAGVAPIELRPKEGLALVNGTQGMLAVGILAFRRAETLLRAADVSAAMSVEAALGTDRGWAEAA